MGTPLDQFQQDNHGLPMDKQHATPSPPVDVQALAPMVSTSQAMPNEAMPTHPDHGRVVTGATDRRLPGRRWRQGVEFPRGEVGRPGNPPPTCW